MSYQILAQKYRPQTFDDLIGQESIIRTLKNSISNGRVANAYIFSGPRGVGKTSVARLLSKSLNCEDTFGENPCNKCVSCREISSGNDMDVLEIDGASNNGVDEIRALRENVKFSPSRGAYKIYIIDEVHMLSQGAFNALLKTLEEPPPHVKFIFATTEAHRVLPTIMSRCQRFDFKRISPHDVLDRIMCIAEKEKIEVDTKAAFIIARASDGSLRDALVILDQMISFSGTKIIVGDVTELLGMVHRDDLIKLSGALIDSQAGSVTGITDRMINDGKDPVFIAGSLVNHFRDLLVLKAADTPTSDMLFSEDELAVLHAQLKDISTEEILYILYNLSHCQNLMKSSSFTRGPLEMTLIKLAKRASMTSLDEIMKRLEKIEKGIKSGAGYSLLSNDKETAPSKKITRDEKTATMKMSESTGQKMPDRQDESVQTENNGNGEQTFGTLKSHWNTFLNCVKSSKMSVYTFLNPARPVEFTENKVIIGFGKEHVFNKEVLDAEQNKNIIKEAVSKVTGRQTAVEITILDFLGEEKEQQDAKKEDEPREDIKPVIDKAMDVFGGHVVRDMKENGS